MLILFPLFAMTLSYRYSCNRKQMCMRGREREIVLELYLAEVSKYESWLWIFTFSFHLFSYLIFPKCFFFHFIFAFIDATFQFTLYFIVQSGRSHDFWFFSFSSFNSFFYFYSTVFFSSLQNNSFCAWYFVFFNPISI